MRFLIDIGHPAHVHYFKNFIILVKNKGHKVFITSRNNKIIHDLLDYYKFHYQTRNYGHDNLIGKLFHTVKTNFQLYCYSKRFKPDIFLSFGSIYAAHISWLLRRPHFAFDDTEHSSGQFFLYSPFTKIIITPSCFKKNFGRKQKHFNGFMELCYLHPNYFSPDPAILNKMGLKINEKYIILRFISWNASHDKNNIGLDIKTKRKIIKKLSRHVKVFITSESDLPLDLHKYRLNIPTQQIHNALYFASYLFGESGTMTAESAMLGVPAIQISGLPPGTIGTLNELEKKYGLIKVYQYFNDSIINKIIENIKDDNYRKIIAKRREKMLLDKIDVTQFMVNFINHYFSI